ncbi:porin [Crenobacter cavernae]|uniref:Porin n=2 Tax=Crenobacter cavernae TaxID=2290923 RepID=A0ABY0FEW6_9NEIS|nr:porin [Crenobacter cavernae]
MAMNKKLIALTLAALPAAAMADVTIFGTLKAGFENVKDKGTSSVNNVADFGSRIGFKGNEDLGNGLKAIWQIQSRASLTGDSTARNTFGSRNTFIGLQGGFGKVRLGNVSDYADSDMAIVNPWESEAAALQLEIGNNRSPLDTRLKNSVRYDSPDFGGFDFSLQHGVNEGKNLGVFDEENNRRVNLVGLGYTAGGLTAKYVFARWDYKNGVGSELDNTRYQRAEVGYNFDFGLNLVGAYSQNNDREVDGSKIKDRQAAVTATYTVGAFTPKFSYGKGWDTKSAGVSAPDTGYDQYIVGVDYALSKRTTAGVSFGKLDNDKNYGEPDQRAAGVQMIHQF